MVYRSLHGLAPNYLSSKFERREVAYNLRDSENKLNVPLPRTKYHKNGFSYSGAILWNSVPCNLTEAESLGQFKGFTQRTVRHGFRGKQLFYLNIFYYISIRHF